MRSGLMVKQYGRSKLKKGGRQKQIVHTAQQRGFLTKSKIYAYCRGADMDEQAKFLKTKCPDAIVVKERFSFIQWQLIRLLSYALGGESIVIVSVSEKTIHRSRFAKLKNLMQKCGGDMIVTDGNTKVHKNYYRMDKAPRTLWIS